MINGRIKNKALVWIRAINIGFASFVFGYTLGVFNPCRDNVSHDMGWDNQEKDFFYQLFSTLVPVGAMFGAMITGTLCSKWGHKKILLVIDIIVAIGSVLSAIPSTFVFGSGRFITGFGAGMCLSIAPMYIGGITPQSMMKSIGPIMGIMSGVGLALSYAFGLVPPEHNYSQPSNKFWQFMFVFPAFIAVYQFVSVFVFIKYDPPGFYLEKKNMTLYKNSLTIILDEDDVEREIAKSAEITIGSSSVKNPNYSELLCSSEYRKMVRNGVVLGTMQQFSGANAILFYSVEIFIGIGLDTFYSRLITLLIGIATVMSNASTIILMKRFGRKQLFISGCILLAVSLVGVGLVSGVASKMIYVLAILVCAYQVFFNYALSATLWSYIGEIQNSKAISITGTVNFLANIVILFVFPIAVEVVGIEAIFYFFSVCMVLTAVYVYYDVIETKDKTKEEILELIFPTRSKLISLQGKDEFN